MSALMATAMAVYEPGALGNPQGLQVSQGSAQVTVDSGRMNVRVSANAVLDWQSFNINSGETTAFLQPSSRSVVWNRINDPNPSSILGNLTANGRVVLFNQSGFYFGAGSVINVGGFLATTAGPGVQNFGGGPAWQFNGTPPAASIINYGQISADRRGSIFLIAEKILNQGSLVAPDGTIGLYAGKEVLLSERPDGRGISSVVRLPEGSIDNLGKLVADAGTISLRAQVVNQNGLIQANSVRTDHGVIELVASERISLAESSTLQARGDAFRASAAGTVTIHSGGSFSDLAGSTIDVRGGRNGGAGGFAEISAPQLGAIHSSLLGGAEPGARGGRLLIDPIDIVIGNSGTGSAGSGNVTESSTPDVLRLNVGSAFFGFSQITLQATRDITIASSTTWDLNLSTGVSTPGSLLILQAGRNIVFGNNARLVAGPGWSVKMSAGDLLSGRSPVAGTGGIYLNGGPDLGFGAPRLNGSIETAEGALSLKAENEILISGGYVRSDSGGSVSVTALKGNIDAGTKRDGYVFSRRGYQISPSGVGGIATSAGGDLDIRAGGDILSFLPTSGAYGPGNVTISGGGRVLGKFLVRDGLGKITAATDVGSGSSPASLSLVKGSWEVEAGRDIVLNEVVNPNGALNPNRFSTGARIPFQFDYALDSSVALRAGNSVQLLGNAPAHVTDNPDRPPIYPPTLEISAGAGGILLGNDVVLFPSPSAALHITTTAGGSFRSTADNSFRLIVSDSSDPNYVNFIDGHADSPIHLPNAADPFTVNISGNLENVRFQFPKRSLIGVGGDAVNFFMVGQNLRPSDETQLLIGGDFKNRSDLTFERLLNPPDFSIFEPLVATRPDLDLGPKLSYDGLTHKIAFHGRMTAEERDFLLHPTEKRVSLADGRIELDEAGNPIVVSATFSDAGTINRLFQDSQDVPAFPTKNGGLLIGGPGLFTMSARSIDLGITAGIRSLVTALNPALARNPDGSIGHGSSLKISTARDLDMTSSQIASFNGGFIDLVAGGRISIGSQEQFTSDDTPKGIYSGSGGAVSVLAGGDIIVRGSRIASYDGGDVSVVSTAGSVDAGEGAKGFFSITSQQINPRSGLVELRNDRFFGSGIIALTRPDSKAQVGNITVKAAQDILANAGGILQLAFNHSDKTRSTVLLDAGRNIEANQSGILGANVSLKAGGDIQGLVVANQNLNIDAVRNVSVTAVASGSVSVKSGESVSGTIVGGGNVSVAGGEISASVISTGGNASSNDNASRANAFQNVAAPAAQQAAPEASKTIAESKPKLEDDEDKKGRGPKPVLARAAGRVTVVLPKGK